MPEAGTKKIDIGGEAVFVPADDAELHVLLSEACDVESTMKLYATRLKELKEQLVAIATKRRSKSATVHLVGPAGHKATVSWTSKTHVDTLAADDLESRLTKEEFAAVFVKEYGYRLTAKTVRNPALFALPRSLAARVLDAIYTVESNPGCKLTPPKEAQR